MTDDDLLMRSHRGRNMAEELRIAAAATRDAHCPSPLLGAADALAEAADALQAMHRMQSLRAAERPLPNDS